jgi:hypothetical protein
MRYLHRLFGSVLAAVALFVAAATFAEDAATKTYPTYHAAAAALIAAVETKDEAAEKEILGANAPELLSSGDSTEDEDSRISFLKHYREAHSFVRETPDRVLLTIGATGWMLPFPIVRADGAWHFDTAAGAQELTYRRIGRNELDAIQVCRALYSAQKAYAVNGHDGNPEGAYAQHFRSQPGTQSGLYWDVKEGEAESPAGSLVAEAASERDRDDAAKQSGKPTPFHGYYYRILNAQGAHARGGAKEYVKDGQMTGGFAIVAYPAEYGASGVMTLLISRHGTVYQSDLGAATEQTAKAMAAFDPDSSWKVVH